MLECPNTERVRIKLSVGSSLLDQIKDASCGAEAYEGIVETKQGGERSKSGTMECAWMSARDLSGVWEGLAIVECK